MHPSLATVGLVLPLGIAAALALLATPAHPAEPPSAEPLAGPPSDLAARPDLAALRARGPAGLEALLARYDHATPAERERLAADVDAVAGQRYATTSRLYWFTELDRAQDEARRLHRPILALRMLGDLRSDLSCANSRLFRATLYADAETSAFLRRHFVLYWSTERAVPTVTIDYGDGRKLVRTTTGNSAHYVLDDRGHVLDVLPGLYAPAVFRKELAASLALADRLRGMPDARRIAATVAYHHAAAAATERDWERARGAMYIPGDRAIGSALVRAQVATVSKAAVEVPHLKQIGALSPGQVPDDAAAWSAIGQRVWNIGSLDASSRALVTALHNAGPAEQRATPAALAQMIVRLEQHIVADTALDQFTLRQTIRRHIVDTADTDFASLNAWIYDQVFFTPRSDAWLGLLPRTDFTGVPGDGVVMPR